MKKKAIEKIPYLTLKKTSRKKDVKYIAVTAVKIVGHEKHLFLEVYRNEKAAKAVPVVRIVLTKKDFGTYFPEKQEWSRQRVCDSDYYAKFIWQSAGERERDWKEQAKRNVLSDSSDLERIKKFCDVKVWQEARWWEYVRENEVNPISYLEAYERTPQLEMLVKLGLYQIVEQLTKYRYGIVNNEYAKSPDKYLGIRKARVKQLIDAEGDLELLEVMQMEYRMQQVWTDEQIEQITETGLKRGQIEAATKYMSLQQLLNRIRKYSGCEYGTNLHCATENIRNTATLYIDYLNMREALGYDLHNTVYQQPRNLGEAHAKMVQESSEKEMDKRLMEVKVRFTNIRSNYRKLRKEYCYEDDTYIIRPARSAEEIVMEGRILHHCVGGNNYLSSHNDGRSYILMLRFKKEPEIPYITVEIDAKTQRILQWYGAHDKKPDQENMQQWLNKYIMKLKLGTLHEPVQVGQTA